MGGTAGRDRLLRVARGLGLFWLSRRLTAGGVRILCYHAAWLEDDGFPGDSMFIRPGTFERRLEALQRLGCTVVSLSDAVEGLAGRRGLPSAPVVITIDDGWLSTQQALVPRLIRRKLPATIYLDTAQLIAGLPIANVMALHFWGRCPEDRKSPAAKAALKRAVDVSAPLADRLEGVKDLAAEIGVDLAPYFQNKRFDYMTPEQLREICESGVDIQLHSHNHTLHDFSEAAILREIEANRSVLAEVTGKPREGFVHFCYPSGLLNPSAGAGLMAAGVASSVTLESGIGFPGCDLQDLPRITDGDQLSDVMFEAEMAGFMHILRTAHRWIAGLKRAARRGVAPATSGGFQGRSVPVAGRRG